MALVSESERHDIRSKWMAVSYKTGIDIMLVLQIGGAGAVIVIFIVLWTGQLPKAEPPWLAPGRRDYSRRQIQGRSKVIRKLTERAA